MKEYHKINSIFKRDQKGKFILGEYSEDCFEYLKNNVWVWTEKVDGTNIRVMWNHETKSITFGGKTDNAQIPSNLVTELNNLFQPIGIRKLFEETWSDCDACLYGEGYGAKIQKGGGNYIPTGVSFVLFDVLVGKWWLKREDCSEVAVNFGVRIVPIIGEGTLEEAIKFTSGGYKSTWGDFNAEGIVLRPKVELSTRNGSRIITKLKERDFKS